MNYTEIKSCITNKDTSPIYFLMGEEPYYINKLLALFTEKILSKEEREFNQTIFYGKDTLVEEIISEAKQYPFGAEKKVVIVKEAQHLKNIEFFDAYLDNPQLQTVLVIAYNGKSIDKRKSFSKKISKKCIVFESKKIYDSQIPNWISNYINTKGRKISEKATILLTEHIGSDLSNLENELNKLLIVINPNEEINSSLIEHHVGISKDYNIFELQNALAKKDIIKANKIINHFSSNSKNHNIVSTINGLFSFFQKVILYHSAKNKDKKSISILLKINPFFLSYYEIASKNYSLKQLFSIFSFLKTYDLRSKGFNNKNTSSGELLRELIFKINYV